MAALTQDRDTERRKLDRRIAVPVKASTTIYAGAMVSVADADGFAIPGADTAATRVIGRSTQFVDNSSGADGDVEVIVEKGVFKYENSSGSALAQKEVGESVLIEDDQTVALTSTNSIAAGIMEEIDDDGGIWVAIL